MAVTTPSVPATTVAVANQTGQNVDVAVTGGTVTGILVTPPSNLAPAVATPAVPATTVTATNSNAFPVSVTIAANGATITAITVSGSASGLTVGTVVVPIGGTVSITYTVATPTWVWAPVVAGFAGTSIPSPSSVPLPPGCSITLTYSGPPTWAWIAPLDIDWIGYAQSNFTAINEQGALPWAGHAEGGEPGLGTGVSN